MEPVETPAPAPIATETPTAPVTAVDQAVEKNDVSSFREARKAERLGQPVPVAEPAPAAPSETPAPAEATPATSTPERTLSKRQQDANERTQRAIEQATRDLIAENARLRAQVAPRSTEPPAAAPTEPEYKRFRAMPDAPKLEQFDSIEDHAAAMALFIADKRYEERDARSRQEQEQSQFLQEQGERNRAFNSRIADVVKTDPQFWEGISPDVKALRPRADLRPGERPTAANDLADEILDNPLGPRLMVHLTEHPDVFDRLASARSRSQLYVELGKLYATFEQAPQTSHTKQISSAPAPVTVLGTKAAEAANPIDAAVADNDVARFRAQRRQARAAELHR